MKIEQIEKMLEEASPGPWGYYLAHKDDIGSDWIMTLFNDGFYMQPSVYESKQLTTELKDIYKDYYCASQARNLMPKLLAVAKAAEEYLFQQDKLAPQFVEENFHLDDIFDDEEAARAALEKALEDLERE